MSTTVTAPTPSSDALIERMNWRYAAKKMDPAQPVPEDKVARIVEAARLAPTSSGLQPFELIVVTNPEVRARIREIAWNQAQITDGSHLLVFAAWDTYTAERINTMFDLTNQVRGFIFLVRVRRRPRPPPFPSPPLARARFVDAARQAYIAMSAALLAAAFEGVDATPMEGFDPAKLDEILGLRARGLRSAVIVPLGHRQVDGDWLVNLPKVRRPLEQFVSELR